MDAFNFGELRKNAPKYLSLDSLKEALQSSEPPTSGYEDVSMPDQQLSDVSDADMADADSVLSQCSALPPSASEVSELESEKPLPSLTVPKAPIIPNDHHIYQPTPEHPLTNFRACITPTQAGAQQALPYSRHDVNMPIPLPWHENFRYILSTYLQLIFNATIILGLGYFLLIVKRDVARKIDEQRGELVRYASWCRTQYIANRCGADTVVPHLLENQKCLELEHGMNADPENIRWLSSYAALLAEVMNAFIVPLQLRTIMTLAGLLMAVAVVIFANFWFGFWRAKSYFADRDREPKQLEYSKDRSSSPSSNLLIE